MPDASLILCAMRCEAEIEGQARPIEKLMQLLPRAQQEAGFGLVAAPAPVECDEAVLFLGQGEVTNGGVE